ncbi:AraC family transcriptional regulator [Paenibacillus baekrokdamisoli]|uniref:AraC family transcriptional regulator n=1 Tax=Paenibacillus baekrokdamisoli TaxID=1712516 RepID=A0A3G9ITA7_9BACL|nr:response regulator [Paenibacillus baekrokdamisoli]MBB3070951.1 YesN/AraC family two-component response regulator [Paenibacillus baekrokdamisoli]BBH22110.1 AraC family transcriptional regulator [Paenibacillus baekrokdamisoli]
MRVLIVDDEQEIRDYIAGMPEWAAIHCSVAAVAANGAEALEIARRERPDVLLTDIRMPVMDGITLAETIRKEQPDLPIIFLSAYNEFDYAKKAIRLGAVDFITKPFVAADLIYAVQQVQQQQQLEWKHQEAFFSLFGLPEEHDEEKRGWLRDRNLPDEPFILLYAELDSIAGMSDERSPFRERFTLGTVIPALERCTIPYWTLGTNSGLYILMRAGTLAYEVLQEEALELANHMVELGGVAEEVCLSVGISQQEQSLLRMPEAIRQIAVCMEYRMLLGKKSVIAYDAIKSIQNEKERHLVISTNLISDLLRIGDHDGISDALLEAYRTMLTVGAGKQEIQHFCIRLAERAENVMEDFGIESDSQTKILIREKVLSSVILTDMMREVEKHVQSCAARISALVEHSPKRLVAETRQMIEQAYEGELTLQVIANQLRVNYSYLSRVIKKETGKNFSDLLWLTRIEAAKAKLLSEDLRAYEVAFAVGFKSYAHFSMLFKKVVGVSPSAYKLHESIQRF